MSKTIIVEASIKSTVRGILTAAPVRAKFHKAMFNHHMDNHKQHMKSAAQHMQAMKGSDPNSKKYVYHQNQAMHHLGSAEHHVNMAEHHHNSRMDTAGHDKAFTKNFHDKFKATSNRAKSLSQLSKSGEKTKPQPNAAPTKKTGRGRPPAFKPPNKAKPNAAIKPINKPMNKAPIKPAVKPMVKPKMAKPNNIKPMPTKRK